MDRLANKQTPPTVDRGRRLHVGPWKGGTNIMDDIRRTELTQDEKETLAKDEERAKHMGGGAHLNDWLAFGPGLMILRRLAMRVAHSNVARGKRYSEAMSAVMAGSAVALLFERQQTAMTAVMWFYDQPSDQPSRLGILQEIRDTMTAGQRARLNSPIAARKRVEQVLKARMGDAPEEAEAKIREAPLTILKRQNMELVREVAQLQERLRRDDGSLFDLVKDTAEDIGDHIALNPRISSSKAERIAKQILVKVKERKTAHAG
jgi:hypothetical protein